MRRIARDSSLSFWYLALAAAVLTFALEALTAQATNAQTASGEVRVRGSVFDSLTNAPLSSARVKFVREADPGSGAATAMTDASGHFEISLAPGRWLAGIEHSHLDSLGVTPASRHIDVPPNGSLRVSLATASARTLTRAFCGDAADNRDAALVGMVRRAGSDAALDSADVFVQWTNLTLARGTIRRAMPTVSARTDHNGWYVLCGVPRNAEILAWAEHAHAATGLVPAQTSNEPHRLDLWIDDGKQVSARALDRADAHENALEGERRRPASRTGDIRFVIQVRDAAGQPVRGVRAQIMGHRPGIGDDRGMLVLDSLPGGSQTLEVRAVGFVPQTRVVHLAEGMLTSDTITLTSTKALLDTVRVTGSQIFAGDPNGFEMRRKTGIGSYIGKAEIDRLHPYQLTSLLQARSGVAIGDMGGDQVISMMDATGDLRPCTPAIWVDNVLEVQAAGGGGGSLLTGSHSISAPPPPIAMLELNSFVRPTEIVGVEIYRRPVEIPPQYANVGYGGCGAIVIWTRLHSALPQASELAGPPNR